MKCCICGKEIPVRGKYFAGNNPFPYVTDPEARCCDECNIKHVIPARLADIHQTPACKDNK